MRAPKTDFLAILRILAERGVEFIVVGGVAAVLQGAPVATFDLDVVHSKAEDNVRKLLQALAVLKASYRLPGKLNLKPDFSHLASPGHQLLITRFGPLDLLGSIGAGHEYGELLSKSIPIRIGAGLAVPTLTLSAVIQSKEETGQDKDLAALPVLRRTLKEKERKQRGSLEGGVANRAPNKR
jgi:hypothetical protein